MSEDIELKLLKEIENLKKKIEKLEGKIEKIPTYLFGKIRDRELRKLFDIREKIDKNVFDDWFYSDFEIKEEDKEFLNKLLEREINLIKRYNEEDLKIKFIGEIINRVNFTDIDKYVRDFYEENLEYQTDSFKLSGNVDYFVSKGLDYPEKPYFFIQEFKRDKEYSNPEPQLLAEMIAATEINSFESIKGAYIIGEKWCFVILKRFDKHKYEYSVSNSFISTRISDLIQIYKNLIIVKNEIFKDIENDNYL
ncbi:MAG: hypothetical protein H7A23_21720 [Leptospiraceae bacterium]|nr:hypothetical protein [Leptospiraceae bacterium]MCP5497180.1 hypothetical protein [Leptospiraceae bacterium]